MATLDTKGRETLYIKECAEGRGVRTMMMDVGTLNPPQAPPDLTRDDLAQAAGGELDMNLAEQARLTAVRTVQTGGAIKHQTGYNIVGDYTTALITVIP